jgi:uncharacterized Zn-binding protein involved in type VI secretion
MSMKPVGWLGQDADRHEHCYPKHKTIEASDDVLAEGFKVVRVGDAVARHGGTCSKHPSPHGAKVQKGSASVFFNRRPMAREGDTVKCDTGQTAPLLQGRATVVAGDASPVARSRDAWPSRAARPDPDLLVDGKGVDSIAGNEGSDSLEPSRIPGVRAFRRGADGRFYEVDFSRERVYTGRLPAGTVFVGPAPRSKVRRERGAAVNRRIVTGCDDAAGLPVTMRAQALDRSRASPRWPVPERLTPENRYGPVRAAIRIRRRIAVGAELPRR